MEVVAVEDRRSDAGWADGRRLPSRVVGQFEDTVALGGVDLGNLVLAKPLIVLKSLCSTDWNTSPTTQQMTIFVTSRSARLLWL